MSSEFRLRSKLARECWPRRIPYYDILDEAYVKVEMWCYSQGLTDLQSSGYNIGTIIMRDPSDCMHRLQIFVLFCSRSTKTADDARITYYKDGKSPTSRQRLSDFMRDKVTIMGEETAIEDF